MSAAVPNIELLIEYDGRGFLGWQQQRDGPSVEATLLDAIEAVTQQRPTLTVAGRTDAGVHAVGQVVNLHIQANVEPQRYSHALNRHLPETVTVHRSREVAPEFNARVDSVGKRYRYRVYQGPHLPALEVGRAWHHRTELDRNAMAAAAEELLGEIDFESFRSVHCDADHAVREMFSIVLERIERPPMGFFVDLTFHANAYCRHMCRILAGTLVEVGRRRWSIDDVRQIRDARDRTRAGPTAPPGGLTLLEVLYP